jgi:uncharacterized protein (TIGR03435 family)
MRFSPVIGLVSLMTFLCLEARSQPPPALSIESWLQAPAGFDGSLAAAHGKVVVLEFWATWCSPCIQAIPHLNRLATEFRGQEVLFLAVTDDDADRLTTFLVKHPMDAIIGIDSHRKAWQSFSVPSIPHTVLIGKDGTVLGTTLPENITSEVLRQALAGKKPLVPPKESLDSDLEWDDHFIEWQDGVAPDMYAIIKPIKTATGGVWPRADHITADGVPLQVLVQISYQTDSYHVDWLVPQSERTYRAAFRVPTDQAERLLPYMRQTLMDLFGIQARWENQQRDVYLLRRLDGHTAPHESATGEETLQMLRGRMTLRRQPITKLCDLLTNALQAVVMDETGMGARYDFDLPYQPGSADLTIEALKNVGLEVTKARRTVRILIVTADSAAQDKRATPQR